MTQAKTRTKRTVKRAKQVTASAPTPVAKQTTRRTVTTQTQVPAAAAAPAPKTSAAPAARQSAVAPVINFTPKPAPRQNAVSNAINLNGEMVPIAAGGALALLALGGAAAAITGRRRKRRAQELADARTMSYEPFETATAPEAQPEPVVPEERAASMAAGGSAFAWGSEPTRGKTTAGQDDRRPGESWVERAYRGPTPNNPSASLRNRLKRAAFFDKREREAAAGMAAPVDAQAGLPGAMAGEREIV